MIQFIERLAEECVHFDVSIAGMMFQKKYDATIQQEVTLLPSFNVIHRLESILNITFLINKNSKYLSLTCWECPNDCSIEAGHQIVTDYSKGECAIHLQAVGAYDFRISFNQPANNIITIDYRQTGFPKLMATQDFTNVRKAGPRKVVIGLNNGWFIFKKRILKSYVLAEKNTDGKCTGRCTIVLHFGFHRAMTTNDLEFVETKARSTKMGKREVIVKWVLICFL